MPELRSLVYKVLDYVGGLGHVVHVTRPEKTFFDYLLTRYSPPRWNFRWCCKRLKELPFKKLAFELAKKKPVLNLLGVRSEEARWRNWFIKRVNGNLVYVAPLRDLKTADVWRLLRKYAPKWVVESLREIYGNAKRSGCWYCPLILHDKLLENKPELLKLKLEILEAWCTGKRQHILELSRKHPELVKVTVEPEKITENYPCKKMCKTCTVRKVRETLKTILELKSSFPKPPANAIEP